MTTSTQPADTMNTYGRQAQAHMRRYLPARYATIPDPASYFRELGEIVAQQILELEQSLTPPDSRDQTWIERVGQALMARMSATEAVMAEMVWLAPEDQPGEPTLASNGGWTGSDPGLADLILPGLTQGDLDEMDASS